MPLTDFGFTKTQDTVYKALLRRREATGYLVARDTRLARANVYQALDSLVAQSVATADGKRPVIYRATNAADVVANLRKSQEARLAALSRELQVPESGRPEGGANPDIDPIEHPGALLSAAAAAIDSAEQEVLAVTGPWADGLPGALLRARERGVTCRVVSLGAPAPDGAVLRNVDARDLTPYWGGLPVLLVCDRAHAVCGVLAGDRAHGLETRSAGLVPFLRHLLRRELATAAAPRLSS